MPHQKLGKAVGYLLSGCRAGDGVWQLLAVLWGQLSGGVCAQGAADEPN